MKSLVVSLSALALALVADVSVRAQAAQVPDVPQLRRAAERGDGDAMYRLGLAYRDGAGVPRDIVEAHLWVSLSSSFRPSGPEESEASRALTAQLSNAQILESNARVVAVLERLAKSGHAPAQFLLGMTYHSGVQGGLAQDYAQAFVWLQRAANQKHMNAQFLLGMMYLRGDGMPADQRKALEWLRKAAALGQAEAQVMVGTAYFNGNGLPKDVNQGLQLWRKAAAQGQVNAQFNLGDAFDGGKGVPQDYREAAYWYRLAAEQGDIDAEFRLGVLHARGLGVLQDGKQAFQWYSLAAQSGHVGAQFNLAMMLFEGKSIPQDLVEAYKWANLAAARAPNELQKQFAEGRDAVAKIMTPAEITEAQQRSRVWAASFERLRAGLLPPLEPPPDMPSGPLRTGGDIPVPKKLKHVEPVYPPVAVGARIQGAVIIEAEIGVDGRVVRAKVLHSPSILLEGPALDAVQQWQYEPTHWRGIPVPVIATVTVTFTLK